MINKVADSIAQALANIPDQATVMIGGFGTAGIPDELVDGLIASLSDSAVQGLTLVNNNAGNGLTRAWQPC
jgi:3-oxoadipate CoA-transferase alpha subunit